MPRALDISGQQSGKLKAVRPTGGRNKHGLIEWLCKCDCGGEIVLTAYAFGQGDTKSCGCLRVEQYPISVATGTWLNNYTYKDVDETLWYTSRGGADVYDLCSTSIERWGKAACRFLEGKKLRSKRIESPHACGDEKVRVYLKDGKDRKDGLEDIAAARQPAEARKTFHDAQGKPWLTEAEFEAKYHKSRHCVYDWHNWPSRIRKGEVALRRQSVPNPVSYKKGSPGTIYVYLEDDITDILAGKEGRRGGRAGSRVKEDAIVELLQALLLKNGKVARQDALKQIREMGIGSALLYKAVKRLGLVSRRKGNSCGSADYYEPGQKPQAAAARVTEKRSRGRPKTSDPQADKRITDAWGTHQYRKKEELARVLGIKESEVIEAIDRHRQRVKRAKAG